MLWFLCVDWGKGTVNSPFESGFSGSFLRKSVNPDKMDADGIIGVPLVPRGNVDGLVLV